MFLTPLTSPCSVVYLITVYYYIKEIIKNIYFHIRLCLYERSEQKGMIRFMKYLLSDDDTAEGIRIGGLGSSNKRKDDENE